MHFCAFSIYSWSSQITNTWAYCVLAKPVFIAAAVESKYNQVTFTSVTSPLSFSSDVIWDDYSYSFVVIYVWHSQISYYPTLLIILIFVTVLLLTK